MERAEYRVNLHQIATSDKFAEVQRVPNFKGQRSSSSGKDTANAIEEQLRRVDESLEENGWYSSVRKSESKHTIPNDE